MKNDASVVQEWLDKIESDGVNLSTWEEDFIDSASLQFKIKGTISDRQEEIIERIYTERVP